MELKLNALDRRIYATNSGEDTTINGISRREVVANGRLLTVEYVGRELNERPDMKGSFISRLDSKKISLSDYARKVTEDTIRYCAAIANRASGRDTEVTFESVTRDPSYARDTTFLRTLAAITQDVLNPLVFSVMSDTTQGGLMQWEPIPFGGTKAIDIASNDVFLFEDSAWGSAKSASYNTLYDKTVTLNPHPYTTQAKIKWYQLMVNGDIGRFYAAIIRGMESKIYAIFLSKLTGAVSNTALIPSGLTASGYTTGNWNLLTTKVAAANGIRRDNLLAFGTISALSKVIPTDGLGAAITGLQYGLGEQWFRSGFLPNAAGVQLLEVTPAIVPGTQNSTIEIMDTGTNIFIAAKGGYGYAPIYGGYYEGTPLTLEMTPELTGDLTIDVTATAAFDTKAVFGSKVGVITSVA